MFENQSPRPVAIRKVAVRFILGGRSRTYVLLAAGTCDGICTALDLLEADLPGFKKEDISVDIEGETLTIRAERTEEKEEKDGKGNFVKRERSYGSFSRSFDMTGIRTEDVSAAYENGVLKLTLPKKQETLPTSRRLEIA